MTIPAWALDACIDDEAFAAAYDAVCAADRALLKTAIARHCAWGGVSGQVQAVARREWRQGFVSLEDAAPVECCLLLLDGAFRSPARMLAALMPALNAGVERVMAVRVRVDDDPGPDAGLLTAFELAGQERVAQMLPEKARCLMQELVAARVSCTVLAFGRCGELLPPGFEDGVTRRVWRPAPLREIPVVLDGSRSLLRLDALAFAHPDARFLVAGGPEALADERFECVEGGIEGLRGRGGPVGYADEGLAEEALGIVSLLFGQGHECCWIWPDLLPEFFQTRRVAWLGQNTDTEEE